MPLNNAATPVASTKLMPTLFVPHGAGPCFFMDWNPPHAWDAMAAYLKGIAAQLPEAPKAILMVSAHWLKEDFVLTSGAQPQLIYDYYGFPPHTMSFSIQRRVNRNWRPKRRPCWSRRACRAGWIQPGGLIMACSFR